MRLESFEDPSLILAFSIDEVPGCREIDLLLVHKELGLYIIEVKAVPLNAIEGVSPNSWRIKGRSGDESPLRQAQKQWEGLRKYWDARMPSHSKLPPVCVTACLPEISRQEWCNAFKASPSSYARDIAEGIIFRDDLLTVEKLTARLASVMTNPPVRTGREPHRPSAAFLASFRSFLEPSAPNLPSLTDRARLKQIERTIDKQIRGEFPPGGSEYAVFTGSPGTGKTYRLLSIAVLHAYSGKRVLFVCFNKTLASDIRRLVSFEQKLKRTEYELDVLDINELAVRCFEMNSLPYLDSGDADEWGRMVVELLVEAREKALIEEYDSILVDEAHDMQDWQLDLLRLHTKPESTVCIAIGKGQELYRDDSSSTAWLNALANSRPVKLKPLRRNFRNPQAQYFAALAFHSAWPDRTDKVASAARTVLGSSRSQESIAFERGGEAMRYVPVPAIPGEFHGNGIEQDRLVIDMYAQILGEEIGAIDKDENAVHVGLLVLVPSENSNHAKWARSALRNLLAERPDAGFIDYTEDKVRRTSALSSEVRLCTFHSARGLEGERVVIFGLEQLESFSRQTNARPENLGFIALSRGLFSTTVVVRTFFETPVHGLLKEIMKVSEEEFAN